MLPAKDPKTIKSNYYDYIKFLYKTQSSVDSITLAHYISDGKECYVNIDGNNRIRAVNHFYQHPLQIFKDNFHSLRQDNCSNGKYAAFVEFLENINYKKLVGINKIHKYIKSEASEAAKAIWFNIFDETVRLHIDDELERVIFHQLKIDQDYYFHTNVDINVVVFREPTDEQLSFVFTNINRKNNPLSMTDILAATLFNADKFNLDFDPHLKADVEQGLNDYYEGKNDGEILTCYTSASSLKPMNGIEFLIAFQNRCHGRYGAHLMPLFDEKVEVMQRLFAISPLFFSLKVEAFTTANVQYFVEKIDAALTLLQVIHAELHPPTLNLEKFKKDGKQTTLTKNGLIFLLIATIKLQLHYANNVQHLHHVIRKVWTFHLLLKDLSTDNEARAVLNMYDILINNNGNKMDANVVNICEHPESFGLDVTTNRYTDLLQLLVKQNNDGTEHNVKPKRRALTYTHRFLLSVYYNQRVPFNYTTRKQNVDHIVAYSSDWLNGIVDLDRVGNLIIIDEELNKGRRNGSIDYYYKKDEKLMTCLDYPDLKTYDRVAKHLKPTTSTIIDLTAYDLMASKLEDMYITNAVAFIWRGANV